MSFLILILVVILIAGVAIYAVDLIPLDGRLIQLAKFIILVIALIVILSRVGGI